VTASAPALARPDAIVDLQDDDAAALVGARWRTADAAVREVAFVDAGADLGPGDRPAATYEVVPRPGNADFDDADWRDLAPAQTTERLGHGRVSFVWYRLTVTLPERVGRIRLAGATVVFEVVVDDYAEVWVDGELPLALGRTGGPAAAGFNAPNRVVLTRSARPGQTFTVAVFGMNGPISAAPANYVWIRSATLDVHRPAPAPPVPLAIDGTLTGVLPPVVRAERVAAGFDTTAGPVWAPDGTLLLSSPAANAVLRWAPEGRVDVVRVKGGYRGVDAGRLARPGPAGLAFDTDGRLVVCQPAHRRVLRVEPHGNTTVLAGRYAGRPLNGPVDVAAAAGGVTYVADPPGAHPGGVYAVRSGAVDRLDGGPPAPSALALTPGGDALLAGGADPDGPAVVRWPVRADGTAAGLPVALAGGGGVTGLATDAAGHVFVAGPDVVRVLDPGGGPLGRVALPEPPTGVAVGAGALFVTSATAVFRIPLAHP